MDGDQPSDKEENKPLTPGDPAQLARKIPHEEYILTDRGACKMQGMPLEVLLAREVKSKSSKSNPVPKLIGSQEVQSIGQSFFLQPVIPSGIIPSLSELINYPASFLFIGYNPLNLILLVVTCNNRILRALLGTNR